MPGLGTPSKPDLRFQSATITQLFVLAKHVPIHCRSVIPSTEGRRWLSCWSHHLLPIGSRISPLQTLPQQLLLLQKAKCSESQVKTNKQKKSELFWNIQYRAVEQHLLESARRVQWALRNPRVSVQWAARKGCFVPLPLQPHQGSACWGVRLLLLGQAQWEARRSSQPPPAVRSAPQATN